LPERRSRGTRVCTFVVGKTRHRQSSHRITASGRKAASRNSWGPCGGTRVGGEFPLSRAQRCAREFCRKKPPRPGSPPPTVCGLEHLEHFIVKFSSFVFVFGHRTALLIVAPPKPQASPKHPMLRAIFLVCVCRSSALSVPADSRYGILDLLSLSLSKFYAPLTARSAGEITASGFTTYFNYEGDLQVHGTRLTSNCAAPGY